MRQIIPFSYETRDITDKIKEEPLICKIIFLHRLYEVNKNEDEINRHKINHKWKTNKCYATLSLKE